PENETEIDRRASRRRRRLLLLVLLLIDGQIPAIESVTGGEYKSWSTNLGKCKLWQWMHVHLPLRKRKKKKYAFERLVVRKKRDNDGVHSHMNFFQHQQIHCRHLPPSPSNASFTTLESI
ncbi:hypothetical protein U1Q18_040195, partial [Sarracenia purpurea var. burkii]